MKYGTARTEQQKAQHAINEVNNTLYQRDDFPVFDSFGKSFYDLFVAMRDLEFEACGTILDFFKNSTPLSAELIDDYIAGNLTESDREKIIEIIFYAAPSSYMDIRYLRKLKSYGYLDITDQALDDFNQVITSIRSIDHIRRKDLFFKVQEYMNRKWTVEPNPVQRHYGNVDEVIQRLHGRSVIYFSPEMKLIGGPRSIFSGGLGVLAGEYVEGLADAGITTYGITLLYKKTIFQRISPYGISTTEEIVVDYSKLPVFDTGIVVEENITGVPVRARVWEIVAGEARIFALEDLTSDITEMLYGGDKETHQLREQQNQLLGRGGIKAIEELYARGIIDAKPGIVHLNEANCYCAVDEIQRKQMFPDLLDLQKIWSNVGIAFTTHTPVPAGLPKIYSQSFGTDDIMHLSWLLNMDPVTLMLYYVQYPGNQSWANLPESTREELIQLLESDQIETFVARFREIVGTNIILNLTEGTAALADGSTSVSLRHEQVTNAEIIRHSNNSPSRHHPEQLQPTTGITNGVNLRDWQPPAFQDIDLETLPTEILLAIKKLEKKEYIHMVNKRTGSRLSEEHLTISIMRRINTYKRTDLILKEIDLLVEELGNQEINVIFSGIPHMKDMPAQAIFKRILEAVNWKHPNIHVAFICQYDVTVAKYAVRGSDIWLMQPIEKKEASSTSHQKALGAGTLVISTYDGAMIENVVDLDINPNEANGMFITPFIIHRTIMKHDGRLNFINPFTEEGNGDGGFFSRPVITLNGGGAFTPVAVIEKNDCFIVVDDIIDDMRPDNLRKLLEEPPIALQQSTLIDSLRRSFDHHGKIQDKQFHDLLYDILDPFSTSDLHKLYDYNPGPWYRLLYKKLGHLARIYTGVTHGFAQYGAQWVTMMRNAILRSYEVDTHRMAAEYIRDIYYHITQRQRATINSVYPERLYRIAHKWRQKYLEDKNREFDHILAERLAYGYLDEEVGTRVSQVKTVPQETTSKRKQIVRVEADVKLGWVVQPDDFDVELYYGNGNPVKMDKTHDSYDMDRICKYTATVDMSKSDNATFNVVISPKNNRLREFISGLKSDQSAAGSEAARLKALLKKLDDEGKRWFVQQEPAQV